MFYYSIHSECNLLVKIGQLNNWAAQVTRKELTEYNRICKRFVHQQRNTSSTRLATVDIRSISNSCCAIPDRVPLWTDIDRRSSVRTRHRARQVCCLRGERNVGSKQWGEQKKSFTDFIRVRQISREFHRVLHRWNDLSEWEEEEGEVFFHPEQKKKYVEREKEKRNAFLSFHHIGETGRERCGW